ncbi:disco-interacting protein 2 B-A-like [Pyrus ussuriensis x Pyrus communis]|uniref:Disco-interacting protein 2 B-A-like n=1 Tax=Pyrus ussuriensis x Pyrus communis TaxID=2448454 RepID=A0A5N5GWT5_9ROSA|nr:disco-interacting protein 2 B-A-like [Pyrus ussuriensis x Pyrus communis]
MMDYENYDPSYPDQPVVDLYLPVWASLPAFRSKPAFVWVDDGSANEATSTLTFGQLNDSVQSIASQLLTPLQRGDAVVILCSPGLELVETIFGCQRAGLLSVPVSPPDPSFTNPNFHHLIRALSQTKPKAALAHSTYITRIQHYISLPSSDKDLVQRLQNLRWIAIDDIKTKDTTLQHSPYKGCRAEDLYLVQYTSGATGIPKPVLVTAGSAAHNVRTARKAYDLHPNSVIVSWLPQYHDCGLMFLLLTIVSGATCVLTSPGAFVNRPRLWLELISNFNATCTPVPSFTLPLVVKRGGVDKGTSPINLWSMKNLIIINEPIYRDAVEQFVDVFKPYGLNPSSISPSYGLAENCTFVSTAWRSDTPLPSHNKLLPSARLNENDDQLEDMNIVVVNEETHEAVEDGIEGEIWVSSPSNASGYLAHPNLTREVYYGRLKNKLSRPFLRTGDRGVVKGEDRYLFVTGRCADVIRLRNDDVGMEIHPHYVETAAYNSNPGFLRGGCLAAFEVSNTVVVVAETQRMEKDIGVLRKICDGVRHGVVMEEGVEVGTVVLVRSGCVPKTTSGKIQRWAAKDKLVGGKMGVLMEVRFGDYGGSVPSLGAGVGESEGRGGGRGGGGGGGEEGWGKVAVGEEREEIFLSFSPNASIRPPLQSFL